MSLVRRPWIWVGVLLLAALGLGVFAAQNTWRLRFTCLRCGAEVDATIVWGYRVSTDPPASTPASRWISSATRPCSPHQFADTAGGVQWTWSRASGFQWRPFVGRPGLSPRFLHENLVGLTRDEARPFIDDYHLVLGASLQFPTGPAADALTKRVEARAISRAQSP